MASELRGSLNYSRRLAPVARSLVIARWCAARGWPVRPPARGSKTPAGSCEACRGPGRTHRGCGFPAVGRRCHGFHAATLVFARIEQWEANPGFGAGIACGRAGRAVVDIDAPAQELPRPERLRPGIDISDSVDLTGLVNGFHTIGVLAALRGTTGPADDQRTLRVRTPSGGLHVGNRAQSGHRWQCSTGSVSGRSFAWQVDGRAHGGYIVAPGTVTEAGAYEPACAAVAGGAAFSEKLSRVAFTAGGRVAAGHLTAEDAEHSLGEADGQARPGQERRYGAIVRGVLSAGRMRPLFLGGR
jgi:hypothetical protein